ncbi:fibronectin type III domain-containing protein [Streptomyces hydrogenans]|uniref:fibronectin type III domain-containing protein n=1 Tax=Streptomyces hydrogenans TaxID=1873719 RepID=UPI0035D8B314
MADTEKARGVPGALNAAAGTENRGTVGAANKAAGTEFLGLPAALNRLQGGGPGPDPGEKLPAPATVTVSNVTPNSADVTWAAVTGAELYVISVSPGGQVYGAEAPPFALSGLDPATAYTVTVAGVSAASVIGNSKGAGFTTGQLLAAPAGLNLTAVGESSFTAEWQYVAATDGKTNVPITPAWFELNTEYGATVITNYTDDGSVRRFTVAPMPADTPFTLKVIAKADTNSSPPASVSGKTLTPATKPPDKIAGLRYTDTTTSSIAVDWTPSDRAVSYEVIAVGGGETFALPGVQRPYNVTGLKSNTEYTITVAGVNSSGKGPESDSIRVYTQHEAGSTEPTNSGEEATGDAGQ